MRIPWSSVWCLFAHWMSCNNSFVSLTRVWLNSWREVCISPLSSGIFQCYSICSPICCVCGVVGVMGVSLSLPPLRVVSSLWSCALGVGNSPCWIMDRGEEGMRAGLEGTYPPASPTLSNLPHLSFFPLAAQTATIHAWREVGSGWLEMCLSLYISVFLLCCFSFSLVTLSFLSPPSSPTQISAGKVKMIEVHSAETGLQMLRKRDKDVQYLDFLPLWITSSIQLVPKLLLMAVVLFLLPLKTWKIYCEIHFIYV